MSSSRDETESKKAVADLLKEVSKVVKPWITPILDVFLAVSRWMNRKNGK